MLITCPSCKKTFRLRESDIFSSKPQFNCPSCQSRFSMNYPPTDPDNIATQLISAPVNQTKSQKQCPKCGALNPAHNKECYSCLALFDKTEPLSKESLKTTPSLIRQWRDIANDYANKDRHEQFVRACTSLQALPYAESKYQQMLELNVQDEIAQTMLKKVQILLNPDKSIQAFDSAIDWKKFFYWFPLILGFLLIFAGMIQHSMRNSIGAGVFIIAIWFGLTRFMKITNNP